MDKTNWPSLSEKEVLKQLNTTEYGLKDTTAHELLRKNGLNELTEAKKKSLLLIFFNQFENLLVLLLIIAVGVSVFIGEFIDAAIISVIIIVNAILGFVQEYRAEKAIEALKKLSAPQAIVLRDGRQQKISAKDLVVGDIILIEEGTKVPADARLIEAYNLQSDESALTGESTPVEKLVCDLAEKTAVADCKNMIFRNTVITRGRGKAVIVSIGMDTQVGKVASMIQNVEEKDTPLQKKLEAVGKSIGIAVVFIAIATFGLGMFRGGELFDMLITAIALAVAAVPEGLPAIVTITLALGLTRMAKAKALVRKLPAVETLGATTVICSDKTGTLTKNEMTVQKIYANHKMITVTGTGYKPVGNFLSAKKIIDPLKDKAINLALLIGTLCTTATLIKNNKWEIFGDPTEGALIVSAFKAKLIKQTLLKNYKHISEIPFD